MADVTDNNTDFDECFPALGAHVAAVKLRETHPTLADEYVYGVVLVAGDKEQASRVLDVLALREMTKARHG